MRINEQNPQFANKLLHSSSPYLRQHAHNPVFWYPWGQEALARAKAEDKPILLSIGYSTCYWCHVMEREVFENLSIASLMNRSFINIKVDREEHPQLDDIYMTARQLMTHEGGWPNNLFLTPDLKPFYAGGTYGANDAYGKPGFPRLIEWLGSTWQTKREEVERIADETKQLMQNFMVHAQSTETSSVSLPQKVELLQQSLAKHFDAVSGGFFKAPKFPHETYLQFLLAHYEQTNNVQSLDMAAFSLGKMAAGGIYDQVGCGFHRYAVDKDWLVPHFEKMLYNQALLARCYTDAARLTGNAYFADIAKGICEFVAAPFTDGNGAFYAAIDAETDEVEGAYYAWTSEEIESLLTPDEVVFFVAHFGLADIPAFPGHKHPEGQALILRKPLFEAALEKNMPYEELAGMAGQTLNKLLAARNMRQSPERDEKIIVSWNGLMIDALAHAGGVFAMPDYIARAEKAARFILEFAIDNDGNLRRTVTAGRAEHYATLEDYAFLIKGLLTLHDATHNKAHLESALQLAEQVEARFADTTPGYFFTQATDHVLIRAKAGDDSTLPSANAVMAHNYLTLHKLTQKANWREKAVSLIEYFLKSDSLAWPEYCTMLSVALALQPKTAEGQCGPDGCAVPLSNN